jgi:hypothetical protein
VNYEEIEQYIHGELADDERQAFEQRMAENPALANEVSLYTQTEQILLANANAAAGETQLTEQLAILNKKYFGIKAETPVIPINKRKKLYYYISGAAAILLAAFLVQPLLNNQKPLDELYVQKAGEIYSFGSNARSSNTNEPDAVALFAANKYKEALNILEPVNTSNTDTLLAKAVCYVETGNSSKAMVIYNNLIAAHTDADRANLYKAMLFLKQGDKAACRTALKQITKTADEYDAATKLLKEL